MNARKAVLRRGLAGGGAVTLLLAVSFVAALGIPTTPSMIAIVAWLVAVGCGMLAAGRRERVSLGSTTLEWPRVAAAAITLLAVGWAAISLISLLRGDGITGLGPLEGVLTAGLVSYFAWFARECWVGGSVIGTEAFVVEGGR
ncbi:hypothetical protein Htur_3092 [Haloterrigena turkmenica DSM 5511]|uniref:Uncharacterized protein n=1 Tax=Haloterrigena turkmenica (strain ATCC 51198 / DSM 5511 / JCM 9101 / NCIMB 13204 / VKM B-1734 / 4k) TaxID=543526 RepID=D2RYY9_HALTV|nr:hypothetical protein [Haloterrigena turkmenica]ADB61957.1 hypothetical protein Htur_3092 [Haloterrigena turkmenica DSM 5511]